MQKTILKIVAITACAGAMMACAKLIWNVTYDRTDRVGIFANLVHEGPQSSILMAGWAVTEYPQGEYVFFPYGNALVASYDDHGKLQWSRELGNSDSTLGAFAMDYANDGAIYVADIRDGGDMLTKLDKKGNLVWEQQVGSGYPDPFSVTMIRVVNDDLILLGMARAPGNEGSSSLLRAVDSNGNQLWQLNGLGGFQQEGQLDQYPFLVQPDAEVLSRNRIVSFYSYSDPEMGADGAVRVLDTEGNTLHSVNQHELGLVRIFDSAVLGEQIVLVGNTADKTRILILNDALAVVRQQDFAKAEFGRLAADHDTLCFALLSGVSWNDFVVADGAALLGVMTSKGKTWSTSRVGAALLDVTLNADNGRCAYTNSIIDGESGNESLARSNFVVYSSKGIEAESKISGISRGFPLVPGFTPHALLRGHHLINLTTDVIWEEESEGEEEPEGRYIARLQKHFLITTYAKPIFSNFSGIGGVRSAT